MRFFRQTNRICQLFGIDLPRGLEAARNLPAYWKDYRSFRKLIMHTPNDFRISKLYPCLLDRHEESGGTLGQYFTQDLYVATRIFLNNPRHHVDVGSRVDGFVAHIASFRQLEVFDVRPLAQLPFNIKFTQADLTSTTFNLTDYCDSASCLHALEHFGLGRYGDPLDADGHLKGLANLYRLLKSGGMLYLSGPVGPQRIEFNAHRVFSISYLLALFSGRFEVVRFSLIDDAGKFLPDLSLDPKFVADNYGCRYGCGIFELRKI